MDNTKIRAEIDSLINTTESYNEKLLPPSLINNLKKWSWGQYGWLSPVSLMFTAAWRKYYYPSIDCCRIWASDENNRPIPGGYSIRSEDESISIPLLAKYDLCGGFCSPNSGMQGSRAIEKMRAVKRLDTNFNTVQRTVFNLKLFAAILNETNDLKHEQLLELIKFYIVTAKTIKAERHKVNEALHKTTKVTFDLLSFLSDVPDPEFTKCVVAACLFVLYRNSGATISGVEDYKTAADARADKPGDLTLGKEGSSLIAFEVKDKTQHIDWNNIERAKRIIKQHSDIKGFVFVLESRDAATKSRINEMVKSPQLSTEDGKLISIVSLHSLYQLAAPISSETEIINITGRYLSAAPAVKPETKELWLKKQTETIQAAKTSLS